MQHFFSTYHFFALSFLLGLVGIGFALSRPTFRQMSGWVALICLPFAFTERFFVPIYWEPRFIGSLFQMTGAGIEDVMFVVFLGWIAVFGPLIIFRRTWAGPAIRINVNIVIRTIGLIVVILFFFALTQVLMVNPLTGAVVSMIFMLVIMVIAQRLILADMLRGMLSTGIIYFTVCLLYNFLYPTDFQQLWRTSSLSRIFLMGVPLEEAVYGLLSGSLGGGIVPFLQDQPTLPLVGKNRRYH
ncbi:MAG: hypothetical protein JW795_17485 [Chitinivibrionales bacterium]|nr:hypothetical protein [Chitinivibrionales bacterium]